MPRSSRPVARAEALNSLTIVAAGWVLISSWALGFPSDAGVEQARLNEALVGVGVFLAALTRRHRPFGRRPSVVLILALGVWLVIAPYVLGYGQSDTNDVARANDLAAGLVIAALATVTLVVSARGRKDGGSTPSGPPGPPGPRRTGGMGSTAAG
ncbi:hypothetical protein G5C60_34650 [Streptomyces sp. HC44]|uniref:SPW repeat-containing integral membrane domain-containing protein n=1 Tax=Streptomyces scabichelini TaxID=2711217 RepID=A0A6G4VFM3_9ACTN|nr:SPW repeat protein [Streptomyces scabichelini]NGO12614.1 hypothetical protein [Streptomyces scabichelini]